MVTKAEEKRIEKEKVKAELREMIKPGDTIHTILRHVSQSGMSRDISVVFITKTGETRCLDYATHILLECPRAKRDGVKIGGCGMDMGFHVVYGLSRILYGDGYDCIGKGCPSNYHVNRRDPNAPIETRHTDGYAINHRWL